MPQLFNDVLAAEEGVVYGKFMDDFFIAGRYHDGQVAVLIQAAQGIGMRVQPVDEDSCSFGILGMRGDVEAGAAEHTVMRIGGIEVRWSDDPPHSFGIWSVVAQPLGEPAAVEHGGGGSHIERVVPVGIPPHGDVDGTLVNQLAPELKDLLG